MKITVCGGLGNYGLAVSSLLSQRGHDVTIMQFPYTLQGLVERPTKDYSEMIRLFKIGGNIAQIYKPESSTESRIKAANHVITTVEAIDPNTEVIVAAYPSLLHEKLGSLLGEQLLHKVLITLTDRFLGGYALLRSAGCIGQKVDLISIAATPFTTYSDTLAHFRRIVYLEKKSVRIAILSQNRPSEELFALLNELLPYSYVLLSSMAELAFNCAPSNLHAVQDLFNLMRYENNHRFALNSEGMSDGLMRIIRALSAERVQIADTYGYQAATFEEYEQQTYATGCEPFAGRQSDPRLNSIPAPRDVYSCKGIEDVACALVPLYQAANFHGVHCPTITSLINLWSVYFDTDFLTSGRNLKKLGYL